MSRAQPMPHTMRNVSLWLTRTTASRLPGSRRRGRGVVVLAAAIGLVLPGTAAATGDITGTVVDDRGVPIAGALVQASTSNGVMASELTELDGSYLLADLDDDTYTLSARSTQPEPAPHRRRWYPSATAQLLSTPITVPDPSEGRTITLPRSATVSGRVLGLTGELLPSARVSITVPTGSSTNGFTIAGGVFTLGGLEPGVVTMKLHDPDTPQAGGSAVGQTRSITVATAEQATGFDLQYQPYVYTPATAGETTVIWTTTPSKGTPIPTTLPVPIKIDPSPTPRFAPGHRTLKVDRKGWLVRPMRCGAGERCDGTFTVVRSKGGVTTELGRASVLAVETIPFDARVRLSPTARKLVAKAGRKGLAVTLNLLGDDGKVAWTTTAKLVPAR
jgi:Carboxypeptidase regulatory-like domain